MAKPEDFINDERVKALAAKIVGAVRHPDLPSEAHEQPAFWHGFIASHLAGRDERIVEGDPVVRALAEVYNRPHTESPYLAVANACDLVLDKSGGLLGRVRNAVARSGVNKKKES